MIKKMTADEYQKQYGVPPTIIPTTSETSSDSGFLQGAANFLGIKKAGQAIASAGREITGQTKQTGQQESDLAQQTNQLIATARNLPVGSPERTRLIMQAYNLGKAPTQAEVDPGTALSNKEVLGSFGNVALNIAAPGALKGSLPAKITKSAATGYAFDVASKATENQDNILKPGVGTVVGGSLPAIGAAIKPVVNITGRLVKNLSSGLSGVSSGTIEQIVSNPEIAKTSAALLDKQGNAAILKNNAQTILSGVKQIKKEASNAYRTGLEDLATTDIAPQIFKDSTQQILDKYGSQIKKGKSILTNVEFTDPKNLAKASELVNKLQTVDLNGKSLRKLADDIENSAYKIATSDERLSFNSFVQDLSQSLKDAISQSTSKLGDINKKYSQDIQLAQAIESVFGKSKFNNLSDIVKASQRLETLFSKKGIVPEVVDDFFNRIGVSSQDFRTSEAVRQITNQVNPSNTQGLSIAEITRAITSSVLTPNVVRWLSIQTGMGKKALIPFLQQMKKPARTIFLRAILNTPSEMPEQSNTENQGSLLSPTIEQNSQTTAEQTQQ